MSTLQELIDRAEAGLERQDSEVIAVLKDHIQTIRYSAHPRPLNRGEQHEVDCLIHAIVIVRLWRADITPASLRAEERKRKGRAKK